MNEIRLYAEGGGDGRDTKAALRVGLGLFLNAIRAQARQQGCKWSIIACGSRNAAFDNFKTALRIHPAATNILLVDSEKPVSDPPRQHLQVTDNWQVPSGVADRQCQLMIQNMEAWLVADMNTLAEFYGSEFRRNAFPAQNVETIDKATLASALAAATRNTQKGEYHKTRHAPRILERLDSDVVCSRAPSCRRLFETLTNEIHENG